MNLPRHARDKHRETLSKEVCSAGACPHPADADFRTEDMFFHSAILGRASAITGDLSYLEMATASMATPSVETLTAEGLFLHCEEVRQNASLGAVSIL